MSGSGRPQHAGGIPSRPSPRRPGDVLGLRYELIERLGAGAMGEVWKARHLLLQGLRAVKLIHADALRDPAFRNRFIQEGQTMMRVRHPAVAEVTDLDEDRGRGELYLVMEYLDGRTLRAAIEDEERPLGSDLRETARVLREIARGMQCVHDEGVVHKDLKSDNVLLVRGEDGREHPKVIDFGLAKHAAGAARPADRAAAVLASAGAAEDGTTLAGTLPYMAPEMFLGSGSSPKSDIYAFGAMGFECLCKGELPVTLTTLAEYMHHHRKGLPPLHVAERRPDVDPRFAAILDHCLAPRPEDRPQSFREVAHDLGWWLRAPERARRRRRTLLAVAAGGTSIALAVWGLFFAGRTASVGQLSVSSAGEALVVQRDRRVHLNAEVLPALRLAAPLEGAPGRALLELDGQAAPIETELVDGVLAATVDLSRLADGPHAISLRPAQDAAPTSILLQVDRSPPRIVDIRVEGGIDGFSSAATPRVLVELDEPQSQIAGVVASVPGGAEIAAQRHPTDDRTWVLVGTATEDGRTDLVVAAHDLAGNEGRDHFWFVRDTVAPECRVADLVGGDGGVLQVRTALGSELRVTVSEAARVSVRVDGALATEGRVDGPGETTFALPPVPASGAPVSVRVADLAGNEWTCAFTVRQVIDEVALVNADGGASGAVRIGRDVRLVVRSTYPLAATPRITARRIRGAGGEPSEGAAPLDVDAVVSDVRDEGRTCEAQIAADRLPAGTWMLAVDGAGTQSYELTVDAGPPTVESVRVLDRDGNEPDSTGFVRTRDVVVEVVVSDQSLSRIQLEHQPPDSAPAPGRRTYRFPRRCEREGTLLWTLGLRDAAGHAGEQTVSVKADWTVPRLELAEPVDGGAYDDVELVRFAGTSSEEPVHLSVRVAEGSPLGDPITVSSAFATRVRLPAGDPLPVDVVAIDDAGHVSEPVRLRLRVAHLATESPPEITWSEGIESTMQRVDAGDVVVHGEIASVGRIYVDRSEVTNALYREFLRATSGTHGHGAWCHDAEPEGWDHVPSQSTWDDPQWNADALPVVNVAWWDAHAFARWSGRRLPTNAEWVRAATRGRTTAGLDTEPREYPPFPRGAWRDGVLATCELTGGKGPLPAAAGEDVSPVGCLHMGGNVSEWIAGDDAAVRGGNWFLSSAAADVSSVPAKSYDRSLRANTIGFRCAMDPGEPGR